MSTLEVALISIFTVCSVVGWFIWYSEVRKDPTIHQLTIDISRLENTSRKCAALLYAVAFICIIITGISIFLRTHQT